MSVHKSLKSKSRLQRTRSVLTREERIAKLEDDGRWSEGDTVFKLPKVLTSRPRARKKPPKAAEAAVETEEAAAAGEAPAEEPES